MILMEILRLYDLDYLDIYTVSFARVNVNLYVNWSYITAVCVSTVFIIAPSKCDGHMHARMSKAKWSASEDDNTNLQLKMQGATAACWFIRI